MPDPSQARLVPQLVPAATGVGVAGHTGPPELHWIADWTHAPCGVQSSPAWQETHAPEPLQTRFEPQLVPAATGFAVAVHTGAPDPHWICDWVQSPCGVQSWPCTHETQVPEPSHTMPVPQLVPAATGVVVAVQIGPPEAHWICDWTQAP